MTKYRLICLLGGIILSSCHAKTSSEESHKPLDSLFTHKDSVAIRINDEETVTQDVPEGSNKIIKEHNIYYDLLSALKTEIGRKQVMDETYMIFKPDENGSITYSSSFDPEDLLAYDEIMFFIRDFDFISDTVILVEQGFNKCNLLSEESEAEGFFVVENPEPRYIANYINYTVAAEVFVVFNTKTNDRIGLNFMISQLEESDITSISGIQIEDCGI